MPRGVAKTSHEERKPWRLLLWATLASLICGLINFGEVAEDHLRIVRNKMQPTAASGEIVFVGIDDRSLSEVGRWPWDRVRQADLIDRLTAAGAERIFVHLIYDSPGTPQEDEALENALRRSGRVVLADRGRLGNLAQNGANMTQLLDRFTSVADTASISAFYNYQDAVWRISRREQGAKGMVPTFAVSMSGRDVPVEGGKIRIDYRINALTIPYVSASAVFSGALDLRGKTVIIGFNADQLGDKGWLPGFGNVAGAYIHILAAETLKRGLPIDLGWLPALLLALLVTAAVLASPSTQKRLALTVGAIIALLIVPGLLERAQIFVDVLPALLAVLIVGGRLLYLRVNGRALINEDTGLPNLLALRTSSGTDQLALVIAKVHNHNELNAALNDHERCELVRQIVARLNASGSTRLFHVEDGTFAWLIDAEQPIGDHLEALHAMFRTPIAVGGRQIDIALSFGVELGSARSVNSRLGSAILAADEAWTEGLRWKLHDPARQEEMNWRVSLLGELDSAIDNGEVWLAYQPQYDLKQGRIIGAEALARWTHPVKGPISPAEFVAAAENNGRIAKLTDFVLDRAISAAAAVNRGNIPFIIAVNLSARLLADRDLFQRIQKMLTAHRLDPSCLTLELTETATLQDAESGLATLGALRELGVRVAIDDYGTGLSTLEYLRKIPATEIKIDQSFIKAMRVNRSDLIMVQSTIALAHSLDRTVVAEGVEDQQCLAELTQMGCDVAQGFAIGRPMGVRELLQRLHMRSASRVA